LILLDLFHGATLAIRQIMPLIGGKSILAPRSADISPQSHTNGKSAFAPQALGKGFDDAAAGNLPITSNRITPRREICEAPAEIPQTPARRGVISLGVSPLGSLAVEIETCLPFENWRSDDVEDGVGPFIDVAPPSPRCRGSAHIDGPEVNRMCKRHGYNLYLSLCLIASVSPLNNRAGCLDSPAVSRTCKRVGYNL
jgi:hypothetical protein